MEFPPSRCIETLSFYQCLSVGFRTLRGHYYRAGAASAGILSGDAWEILECQGIGFIGNLGWFPSSGLGTHVLQAPAWSFLGKRELQRPHSQAGAWERAEKNRPRKPRKARTKRLSFVFFVPFVDCMFCLRIKFFMGCFFSGII